jgi:DNA-binding response OmpR family regulator
MKTPDRRRVLVVDDDPQILELTSAMLRMDGYIAQPAMTLAECFDELKLRPFFATLLDLRLPDSHPENTLAAIPLIKAAGGGRVIVITGMCLTREHRVAFARSGADDCVEKMMAYFAERLSAALEV